MNNGLIVAIVAASVLTACSGRPSTARDERDAALVAHVEAFTARLAASDEFSGVVLLARHGQPLVRRGYGLADRKAGRPNTPETPFMLSSVSKMFTAVTIAKLVERKQLSGTSWSFWATQTAAPKLSPRAYAAYSLHQRGGSSEDWLATCTSANAAGEGRVMA